MKQCLRCKADLSDDYILRAENNASGLRLTKKGGLTGVTIAKINVLVCPACGEVSLYVDKLDVAKP